MNYVYSQPFPSTFLPHRYLNLVNSILTMIPCGKQTDAHPLKDVHVLILETYECVTLPSKRDFADVITSLDPKMGRLSWIIQIGSMLSYGSL